MMNLAAMILALLFTIGFCVGYFGSSGNVAQSEKDLDRQILRQMYANQAKQSTLV